jgi:hypothetical protein
MISGAATCNIVRAWPSYELHPGRARPRIRRTHFRYNIAVTAGQLTGSKVRSQKAWAYSIGSCLHPKRAGRKLWGNERSEPEFREENNCKDPKIRLSAPLGFWTLDHGSPSIKRVTGTLVADRLRVAWLGSA